MQKFTRLIREYSKNNYLKMTRMPQGQLKYPFIVPGSSYSNSLWDWDSWLTDIAVRQIMLENGTSPKEIFEYEKGCIYNFVSHTLDNGKMPISIYADRPISVFRQEKTNTHKPCLAQHTAFIVRENDGDFEWVKSVWGTIERYMAYYLQNCKHKETGLFFFINDWAIGVDNDPCTFYRPDGSSASIYLNCMLYKELLAMDFLGDILGHKSVDYCAEAKSLKKAVNENLWDEKCGFYFSADLNLLPREREFDVHSGMPRSWDCLIQRIDVWSGFMALWAGIADDEKAERVVRENLENEKTFCAKYGIRTLSRLEKMYTIEKSGNPSCWLGPIWGISNYMCFKGLVNCGFDKEARDLVEKTVMLFGQDLEKNGVLHEYYDPDSGEGVNNPGFQNWNLLVNNMLAWYENKPVIWEF